MKKKLKVFLGAYINSTNAQNLNCLALARHLNKERFQVGALHLYSGNLSLEKDILNSTHLFPVFRPHRYSRYLAYFLGILWADVVYLPKGEICRWNKFWMRTLKKRSFTTVEGIYGDKVIKEVMQNNADYQNFKNSFKGYDKIYSITSFLRDYNFKKHGIETDEKILYLGTETEKFLNEKKFIEKLGNVIYVGRLKERKGIFDVLKVAKAFPDIHFHLVGDGEDKNSVENFIRENGLENVSLLGILSHDELAKRLKEMDLHLFPSYSEGFPKVTLETAAAGVPSVVYPYYGAEEWIENGKNGFIVQNVEEIIELFHTLNEEPERLRTASKNAIEMAKRFDWEQVIKDWEQVIEELYNR